MENAAVPPAALLEAPPTSAPPAAACAPVTEDVEGAPPAPGAPPLLLLEVVVPSDDSVQAAAKHNASDRHAMLRDCAHGPAIVVDRRTSTPVLRNGRVKAAQLDPRGRRGEAPGDLAGGS